MDSYRHRYSVAKMASRLGVSVSSYYDYRSVKHMVRVVKKAVLGATIKHHFYACKELTTLLTKAQVTRSNSRKANCWDNAVVESFFKTLKCELVYRFKNLLTAQRMKTEIFHYIECWYNKKRRHSEWIS